MIIYFYNLTNIDFNAFLQNDLFTPYDIEKINSYRVEEVKKERAVSLYIKRKYIREYTLNEYGKPLAKKGYFNISHSHGYVVFVYDEEREVGIDIERLRKVDEKLKEYISSKEERLTLIDNVSFFKLWTSKEALVKCCGSGFINSIKEVPGLPLVGKKEYQNEIYHQKQIIYQDAVITICRKGAKIDEDIIVKEEFLCTTR